MGLRFREFVLTKLDQIKKDNKPQKMVEIYYHNIYTRCDDQLKKNGFTFNV